MSSDAKQDCGNSWRNLSVIGVAVNSTIASLMQKTSWNSMLPGIGRLSAPTDAMTAKRPGSSGRSQPRVAEIG